MKVDSATSITVAPCDPHAKAQQFRWASESRILSLSLKLCLGATEIKDWVKVLLFECDENSELQHWQCKNETLFGLKDQDLHLNWGNRNERNIMIYKGSGLWSRWRIFGTRGDLCSKGFEGRNCGDSPNSRILSLERLEGCFRKSCQSVCRVESSHAGDCSSCDFYHVDQVIYGCRLKVISNVKKGLFK